ncbi:KEOPS complex subunit Pcc1 [Candidatus Bilamarchaeum dharawalense]|uniref:KEOPS complex subunit Pcc1 n=1 Tax=Candidatus Bilamarchaeum dharawalense TaxID=2885759 RepID=A0A5E4LYG1_9ARCH|nr:KEOPS complex subunit Pcc1 [Candidatus Bilamarchaeum dharawalense]
MEMETGIGIKATCSMKIEFPDEKSAEAAEKAISHEGDVGNRSTTRITKKGKVLTLDIDAHDVVALRATANACLRALQVFESLK